MKAGWTTPLGFESSKVCRPICSQEVRSCLPPVGKNGHTHAIPRLSRVELQGLGRGTAPQVLRAHQALICCLNLEIPEWEIPQAKPPFPRLTQKCPAECRNLTHPLLPPTSVKSSYLETVESNRGTDAKLTPLPPIILGSPDTFEERAAAAGGRGTSWKAAQGPGIRPSPHAYSSPVPACQLA